MRLALRSLFKNPGFSLLAMATIALGVAINTGNFAFMKGLLLRSTPAVRPDRMMMVCRSSAPSPMGRVSPGDAADFSRESSAFETVATCTGESPTLEEPHVPAQRLAGMAVSADFFKVFGVRPLLGRAITDRDTVPGTDPVLVLGERFWRVHFDGDPAIVGRTLRIDGRPAAVIGVMPDNFDNPLIWGAIDVWEPEMMDAQSWSNRRDSYLQVIGRLRAGISPVQAQAEANTFAAQFAKDHPETDAGLGFRLMPWNVMRQGGPLNRQLLVLTLALAGFVLLIACANLANLCLARSADRLHEYAVRFALGSSWRRVFRQCAAEGAALAAAGGLLGIVGVRAIVVALERELVIGGRTGVIDVPIDGTVIAFAAAVSAVSALVYAVSPLILIARPGLFASLKSGGRTETGGRSGQRLRHVLVAFELGLSLMLIAGAGFFVHAIDRVAGEHLGWQPDALLTANLVLPDHAPYGSRSAQDAFRRTLESELARIPGVTSVAIAHTMPIFGYGNAQRIAIQGRPTPKPGDEPVGVEDAVSPGYLSTFGVRLLRGRFFQESDGYRSPPVAVIDETMARSLWPGEDPLGRHFQYATGPNRTLVQVVGIVEDVHAVLDAVIPAQTPFQIYRPWSQSPGRWISIGLRCAGRPEALEATFRKALFQIDPGLAAYNVYSARQQIGMAVGSGLGTFAKILGGFAIAGLALAAVGVYGIVTTFVVQRTPEIGIRMALGARGREVVRLVVAKTLVLGILGAMLGMGGAFALLRVLGSMLPGVAGTGATLLGGAVLLVGTGAAAAWFPARRATRVDPIVALRAE